MIDKEEYRIIFKEVDDTIGGIFIEFQEVISLLKNDSKFVRMRLLIAFSFLEVICGIFDKFYDLNIGNKDLMKKWFKDYCLTEKNQVYREHAYIKNINEDYLYELRCSIVHAFALPEQKNKNAVMFVNGSESHPNATQYNEQFKRDGWNPIIISTDSITALFIDGARNLSKEIFINENYATEDNLNALKRIKDEFFRRGANLVRLKDRQ